jgi:hypothetical protein
LARVNQPAGLLMAERLANAGRTDAETCIAAGCSAAEKAVLFAETATKLYRLAHWSSSEPAAACR